MQSPPSKNLVLYENSHGWVIWRNWSKLHRRDWARININLLIGRNVGKFQNANRGNGRRADTKTEERRVCLRTTCNSEFQECSVFLYVFVERDGAERMIGDKIRQASRSQIVKVLYTPIRELNFILYTMGIDDESQARDCNDQISLLK